jgi:hypothetical protein
VQIDADLWIPFLQSFDVADGFGLGDTDPIAVEIERIVIGAPAGPSLGMLGGEGIGVGLCKGLTMVKVLARTFATILSLRAASRW